MSNKTPGWKAQAKSGENPLCKAIHGPLRVEIFSTYKSNIAQRVCSHFQLKQSTEAVVFVYTMLMRVPVIMRDGKTRKRGFSNLSRSRWDKVETIAEDQGIGLNSAKDVLKKLYRVNVLTYKQIDSTTRAYAFTPSFMFWATNVARCVNLKRAVRKNAVAWSIAKSGWLSSVIGHYAGGPYTQGRRVTSTMPGEPTTRQTRNKVPVLEVPGEPTTHHASDDDTVSTMPGGPTTHHSGHGDAKNSMPGEPTTRHVRADVVVSGMPGEPNLGCRVDLPPSELIKGVNHHSRGGGDSRERTEPTESEKPTTTTAPLRYYLGMAFEDIFEPRHIDDDAPGRLTPDEWDRLKPSLACSFDPHSAKSVVRMDSDSVIAKSVAVSTPTRDIDLEWENLGPDARRRSARLMGLLIDRNERKGIPSALSERIVQLTYYVALYGDFGGLEDWLTMLCQHGQQANLHGLIINGNVSHDWPSLIDIMHEKFGKKKLSGK